MQDAMYYEWLFLMKAILLWPLKHYKKLIRQRILFIETTLGFPFTIQHAVKL